VKLEQFGKDHWSTFAYAETCCVDNNGEMDNRRLRINEFKRPLRSNGLGWSQKYGTMVKGGNIPDPEHDDWDCLEGLENLGLLIIVSLVNALVVLTDERNRVAGLLRSHKANGGAAQ